MRVETLYARLTPEYAKKADFNIIRAYYSGFPKDARTYLIQLAPEVATLQERMQLAVSESTKWRNK